MKKTAKQTETRQNKTASLSELFSGTPLEGIFKEAEANMTPAQNEEAQYQAAAKPEYDKTGFIAPLVFSYETFTLIEGMAAHLKALVCNEIGIEAGERIFSLVDQIKRIAGDGKEEIGATGLSW